MYMKSAYSTITDPREAVKDIKMQLTGADARMIIFFASSNYDVEEVSQSFSRSFPGISVFGCTTAGEITSGKVLSNSIVAMQFDREIVEDVKIEVVKNIKSGVNVDSAFNSFEEYFGEKSYNMDITRYIGIILVDGLSMQEEKIMDLIGNRTDVTFIGGSAGDDLKFSKTYVCSEGHAYEEAAVLALIKMNQDAKFDIIKTQSFEATDEILTANKVDERNRRVLEFNNKSALEVYAEAVGESDKEKVSEHFMANPLGVVVSNDDIYVRSPQKVVDDGIQFYCNILEGMEVNLLKATNIIEDTKMVIKNKEAELGGIDGLIDFHCILRALELQSRNKTDEYGRIFTDIPAVGFATYGEQYIGHINQTSTILVFKKNR